MVLILTFALESACRAQDDVSRQSNSPAIQNQTAQGVSLPATTTWKFGIRMTGSGDTENAQVTFPVPVEWPEQKVRLVSIDTTRNVRGAKIKKLGADASQLFFKVPRLAAGELAEATVTVEVVKLASQPPADPHQFVFANSGSRKLRNFLTESPYIESNDPRLRELAKTLPLNDADPAWSQVEAIYTWVRANIEYKFDTEIRTCLAAIDAGHGDCEEMSSLFIALCRARGIPARAVWIPEHTYPEFYLEDEQGNGYWFPCQAAGSYAFGHMPEAKPILQKGDKFKVAGHSKPLRYIQPTMKAYGATPQWEWLMTQIPNTDSPDSQAESDR